MNLFKFEWKQSFKGQMGWIIMLCFTCLLFLSLYPVYFESKDLVLQIFGGFPPELLLVFGLDPEMFFAIEGFYLFTLTYLYFVGGMQAANLGIGLLSKENRSKTNDFLFSKPISRSSIFIHKVLTQIVFLVISNVIITIVSYFCLNLVATSAISLSFLFHCSLSLMMVQWFFSCLGTLLGVLVKHLKNVSMLSLLTVFVFYGLSLLENIIDNNLLKFITPFKFFDSTQLMVDFTLNYAMVGFGLLIGLIFVFLAYGIFVKQDIHAV